MKADFEIVLPNGPCGYNASLFLNGQPLDAVRRVELCLDIKGTAVVKLEVYATSFRFKGPVDVLTEEAATTHDSPVGSLAIAKAWIAWCWAGLCGKDRVHPDYAAWQLRSRRSERGE